MPKVVFAEFHTFSFPTFSSGIRVIHEYLVHNDEQQEYTHHRLVHADSDIEGDEFVYLVECHLYLGNEVDPTHYHLVGSTNTLHSWYPNCFLVTKPDAPMPFRPSETIPSFFEETVRTQFLHDLDREAHPAPTEVVETMQKLRQEPTGDDGLPAISTSSQHSS